MVNTSSIRRSAISKTILGALLLTLLQVVPSADWLSPANAGYPNPGPLSFSSSAKPDLFTDGVYIIDAGAQTGSAKQSIAQGVKPYGLVYALVKAKIPVQWVINPNKDAISQTLGNVGTDFTYDCDGGGSTYSAKNYKTGAFIITKDFAAQATSLVTAWRAKGVVVDGICSNPLPTLPVFATIKSWPRTALDAQNGAVAVTYFTNAEIPQGDLTDPLNPPAYRMVAPSALTPCDDMYVMPHADPTFATHKNLIDFVKAGGDFYASCHAVSVVENMTNGVDNTTKVMNFLSTNGLINYDAHVQGSPPYTIYDTHTAAAFTYTNSYVTNYADGSNPANVAPSSSSYTLSGLTSGDPIAQFIGVTDAAQQQGSEQIFMPAANSRWRPTTQVVVYDASQTNSGTGATPSGSVTSPGPAATVLYGPAFGNNSYGQVMYVGGHSSAKGTVDDVAAQRLFFNFQLLAAVNSSSTPSDSDRTPSVTMTALNVTSFSPGEQVAVEGIATGGSGSFRYSWSSSCFASSGAALTNSGTFDSASSNSTNFTAPSVTGVSKCNLTLTAIDTCGRYTFGFQSVGVAPKADVQVTETTPGSPRATGSNQIYTIVVKNNGDGPGDSSKTAPGVLLTTSIPAEASFVSVSNPVYTSGAAPSGASCALSGSDVTCDLKDMLDEQSATITLVVKPNTAGSLTIDSVVSTTATDVDLTNNEASLTATIAEGTPTADLTLSKTPETQQVSTGGVAAFKLEVENSSTGGITLNNIALTDTFNIGGSIQCYEAGVLRLNGSSPATYTIPTLAPGAVWTAACEITGATTTGTNDLRAVPATQTISGTTTAATLTANSNTASVTVGANSALSVEKSSDGSIYPGGKVNYTVKITNSTGSNRTGIKLGDVLPAGVSAVAKSATIKSTDLTATSNDVNAVVARDKFNYSDISSMNGGTGFSTAWSIGGTGSSSISSSSLKFSTDSRKTFTARRSVSLSSLNSNVSVLFECSGESSAPSITVSLGSKTWDPVSTCGNSNRQFIALTATASEIGLTSTAAAQELKFAVTSGTSSKNLYIDDVSVVSNVRAADLTFNSSLSGGTGFSTGVSWTKVDSANKLSVKSSSGVYLRWKDASSSDVATLSRTVHLPSSDFASAKLTFSYAHQSITAGNFKVCINDNTCASTAAYSDSGSSAGSTDNSSNMSTATVDLPLGDATKITLYFKGSSTIYVDDVIVTASPKGSSNTLQSGVNLSEILAQTYSLANGASLTLTYSATIAKPYPINGATGIVNLASASSTGQATPSWGVVGDPFTKPQLSLTKSASATSVRSGSTVTYTYVLTNSGTQAITIDTGTATGAGGKTFTPIDDACAVITRTSGTGSSLAAGATWRYTCSATINADVTGTVSVSAIDPGDATATLDDSDSVDIKVVDPKIQIVPSPTSKSIYTGSTVGYTYKVTTGTGNVSLRKVAVSAANCPSTAYTSGDINDNLILETNEEWTFSCTSPAINSNQSAQNAVASGENTFDGSSAYDTQTVAVTVVAKPILHLEKTVTDAISGNTGTSITVGSTNTITYTYKVWVENGPLTGVKINCSGCSVSMAGKTGDTAPLNTLSDGETWTVTCLPGTLSVSEISTATAYGTDVLGNKILSQKAETGVIVENPALLLNVEPDNEYVLVNSPNTYHYTVKNTGGVVLTGFHGRDERCATPDITFGSIAIGATATAACTYAHLTSDTLTEFSGYATYGASSTIAGDTSTVTVFVLNPQFNLVKKATVYEGNSNTVRTALGQTVSAFVGDKIIFTYELSAETGTGASRISGLNSLFKASYTDADCVSGGLTSSDIDGYNSGDLNHNGYIDPQETWVYTCLAISSLTDGVTSHSLRAIPVGNQPLAKIRNGGLNKPTLSAALRGSPSYFNFANSTITLNSPSTFAARSSLDNPTGAPTVLEISKSSTVVITLDGVTVVPPAPPSPSLLTPKITWPNPAQQVGPWTLTPAQLNASCSVPGSTLTYSPKLGEVLQPGTYVLTVTCTPPAGSGYGPLTTTVPFTVVKPEAKITWPTPAPVTGPVVLGPTQLNATCSIPGGTLTYDPARFAKLTAGTYTLKVTCTPPAGSIYGPVTSTVQFVVTEPGKIVLDPPSVPVMKLVSGTSSTIAWVKSPNAIGYYVTFDDKRVCTTNAVKCTINKLVGPNSDVKIYATKGSLTSAFVVPTLKKSAKPQVIGMVYFDSAKFNIKADQRAEIKRVAGLLKKLGYTDVIIGGHTDSNAYDNLTLSNNRATATEAALAALVPGLNVDLHYSGATQPMASNSTLTGQAKNRRAEISVW